MLEDSTTLLGGTTPDYRDIAGRWFEPDTKLLANVRYQIGSWGMNWQQRYMPETRLDGGLNPVQAAGVDGPNWVQWEPGMTFGHAAGGRVHDRRQHRAVEVVYRHRVVVRRRLRGGASWEASLSVTNLFDVDPPVIPSFDTRFSSHNGAEQFRYLWAAVPGELPLPFLALELGGAFAPPSKTR